MSGSQNKVFRACWKEVWGDLGIDHYAGWLALSYHNHRQNGNPCSLWRNDQLTPLRPNSMLTRQKAEDGDGIVHQLCAPLPMLPTLSRSWASLWSSRSRKRQWLRQRDSDFCTGTMPCTVNRSRHKVKYDTQFYKVASSEGQLVTCEAYFAFLCVKYASPFFYTWLFQMRLKWNQQRIIVKHLLHNMCKMWLCAGARFTVWCTPALLYANCWWSPTSRCFLALSSHQI
jgi:hypothetical protein